MKYFIQVGTHAEFEPYALRRGLHDGILINANLVESSPGATATRIAELRRKLDSGYLLNPYTHVFTLDPAFLKAERKTTRKLELKSTFRALADRFGKPFKSAVGERPLTPRDFQESQVVESCAAAIVEYQRSRIALQIRVDKKAEDLLQGFVSPPECLLAPYFYFDATRGPGDFFGVNLDLARAARECTKGERLGVVICVDRGVLSDHDRLSEVILEFDAIPADDVFLWISRFREETAGIEELRGLISLVSTFAATGRGVHNLHGGFFSLCLQHVGMSGYSHGVGYGESRDVQPATGGGLPPERFYYPELHSRLQPGHAESVIKSLRITTPDQYHDRVCDCGVCRVVVKDSASDFRYFAELGPPKYGRDGKARRFPTQESIQRSRYHYLLNRVRERRAIPSTGLPTLARQLRQTSAAMVEAAVPAEWHGHLPTWAAALEEAAPRG